MKFIFTQEDIESGINKIEIEDIIFTAEYLEGAGKSWIMEGTAIIDDEVYNEYKIEFETVEEPPSNELIDIMNMDWEWYDFIF